MAQSNAAKREAFAADQARREALREQLGPEQAAIAEDGTCQPVSEWSASCPCPSCEASSTPTKRSMILTKCGPRSSTSANHRGERRSRTGECGCQPRSSRFTLLDGTCQPVSEWSASCPCPSCEASSTPTKRSMILRPKSVASINSMENAGPEVPPPQITVVNVEAEREKHHRRRRSGR
jgi:hypothetical protein